MTLSEDILKRAKYWATSSDFDADTRQEIATLLGKKEDKELTDRFYRDLEFGTGGMRGILGAGTARMNVYNIRKATTAFAQVLLESFPNETIKLGVTYDSRHYSREFAEAVAETMAAHGIKTLITKELRPVPMLSFMVRSYGCKGGVCITASHNPPNYNGYKVYWSTGGQIVPPFDAAVIKKYQDLTNYGALKRIAFAEAKSKGLIEELGSELDEAYFSRVAQLSLNPKIRDDFKIVFTPLHGTAGYPVTEVLKRFGFSNVHVVAEQMQPDGNFPTVKFPNPEEPEALKMAVDLAKKINADLVLGTDPDCDRVGIVYRDQGSFVYLNGNQIGCLLVEYVLSSLKEKKALPDNALVIKTIVTTDLQTHIGQHYGAHVDETLTGFKWICNLIEEYESGKKHPYRKYICGGEESYGFLMDSFVRDKDGMIACAIAAEMTAYYKERGLSLHQVLDQIYLRHGVFLESLHTLTLPGKEGADKITAMMDQLRIDPPRQIDEIEVKFLRDVKNDIELEIDAGGFKPVRKLGLPSSDVLQFVLVDGTKVSVRPSGTEPKIKFYVSVCEAITSQSELEGAKFRCRQRLAQIESIFVEIAKK